MLKQGWEAGRSGHFRSPALVEQVLPVLSAARAGPPARAAWQADRPGSLAWKKEGGVPGRVLFFWARGFMLAYFHVSQRLFGLAGRNPLR